MAQAQTDSDSQRQKDPGYVHRCERCARGTLAECAGQEANGTFVFLLLLLHLLHINEGHGQLGRLLGALD